MHRNLGVFCTEIFRCTVCFHNGKVRKTGFTKGRDRSFHFGTQEYKIIGMISHLGPQLGIADRILCNKLKKTESNRSIYW